MPPAPTFAFSFHGPSAQSAARAREAGIDPLEDTEDYEYLAMRACQALGATDAAFRIGGFGTQDWRFDVAYDMSAFLEELPYLIEALRAGDDFEFDLYPQGVERTLTFTPQGPDQVRVECASRTSWTPSPAVETHSRAALLTLCAQLTHDVATALTATAPTLAALPPFPTWRHPAP